MMVLNLTVSISDNAEKIIFSDTGSVWGDPDKATVAVLGLVKYNAVNSPDFTFTDVFYDNTADNGDITEFEADYIKDGWHTVAIAVLPLAPANSEGNIRYNTTTLLVEEYVDGSWVPLTDYDKVLESETLIVSSRDIILYSKHTIQINCLWLDIVNNRCKDKKCATETFWFARGQLFSMLNQFAIGNKWEAQRMMENIEKVTQQI
jgi:hypothetical protein